MREELLPFTYNPSRMRRAESREVNRALARLRAFGTVEEARIEQAAEIQALRTDAIAYAAKRGMQNIAMVSQVEMSLATMVPHASGRLAVIGDMASLAIAEVVSDTARRIR